MVNPQEKKQFIDNLANAHIMMIEPEDVDNVLCKNANHGLGLGFFELFKILMPSIDHLLHENKVEINMPDVLHVGNENIFIEVSYEKGFPYFWILHGNRV